MASALVPSSVLVLRGPRTRGEVALTFDDGPDDHTGRYLDVLERYGARATFFVLGECAVERRAELREMVRRGHEVASHGFSHAQFVRIPRAELDDELDRTADLLPAVAGRRLVRPPGGAIDARTLVHLARRGYRTVLWSVDSYDAVTATAETVAANLAPRCIRAGDIVLLHEGQRWTLQALGVALKRLRAAGWRAVTVSELLRS